MLFFNGENGRVRFYLTWYFEPKIGIIQVKSRKGADYAGHITTPAFYLKYAVFWFKIYVNEES